MITFIPFDRGILFVSPFICSSIFSKYFSFGLKNEFSSSILCGSVIAIANPLKVANDFIYVNLKSLFSFSSVYG